MTDTILCAAFCGTGKTYICNQTTIQAIEIEYWKYEKEEKQKYIKDVENQIGKVDYIFLSTQPEALELLQEKGYSITLAYPENSLRNEYLDRYIERDSPYDFIGTFMKYWNKFLNELKELEKYKHIILRKGEFLQDYIEEM